MATFTVRVELRSLADDHPSYTQVHKLMYGAGFVRAFKDDDGDWVKLPPAEYIGESTKTAKGIAAELHSLVQHLHDKVLVIATQQADFGYAGARVFAPVAHKRSGTPGVSACGMTPLKATWIRPSETEAHEFAAANGGIVCGNCF